MTRLAISYRRVDSTVIAGRILDRLAANYGSDSVFMDIHSIPYGTDFREYIQKALSGIDVLLVIIGSHWLGESGDSRTRISDSEDLVRIEVETALKRGILVVPVLISGAIMPTAAQLPASLKPLAGRNAAVVDGGRDFHPHMDGLIRAIDQMCPGSGRANSSPADQAGIRSKGRSEVAPRTSITSFARDVLISVLSILIAHYVLVVILDVNTLYLRLASVVTPLICAVSLYRKATPDMTSAILASLSIALIAVFCMALVLSLSFGHPILPATRYEWRETVEYLASIGGAFFVGYLLAPSIGRLLGRRGARPVGG